MVKQLWYVAFLVIILVGISPTVGQDLDPNLVAWWTFDGDATDLSGNGHNGTLVGAAGFADEGMVGGSLALYNNGYVNIDGWPGILGASGITVTAWVKTTSMGTGDTGSNSCDAIVGWGPNGVGTRFGFRINAGRIRTEHHAGNLQGDTVMADGQWHHVAVTVQPNATISYPEVILYLDGQDDTRAGTDPDVYDIQPGLDVRIGSRPANNDRFFNGLIDEVRIYNRTFSGAEIEALAMRPKAYNPEPADGAVGVANPLLSWQPRQAAVKRDVYLGTSADLGLDDLVADGSAMNMYWHAPGLEPGTTYYWRVDEIDGDGTVHIGDVWTFTATPNEAFAPTPPDGAPNQDASVTLSWMPGLGGMSHDVYFGTDETAVAEGSGDTFKGNTFETTFVPGDLQNGTTYYWRVDELRQGGEKIAGEVWSFSTLPVIAISDPNLVAYWKFDNGLGSTVTDWSGHGRHGQFEGDPTWVPGYDGYALDFDGDGDSVVCMLGAAEEWPAFTVSIWAKAAYVGQDNWSSIYSGHTPNTAGFQIDVDGTVPGNWRVNPGGLIFGGVTTDWVHLGLSATGTAAKLYYNGVWVTSGTLNDSMFNVIAVARNRNIDNSFAGIVDDVRVYDRELSLEELQLVMRIDPLRAWNPSPADASVADVRTASPLTWTAGDSASQHDVYFGTDEAAVAAADASDTSGIYRGRIGGTSYTPAEGIAWGQAYFWRVDEINADGSITAGRVWSFTVADYLIVDDFESYTNESPNRVFQAWIDGLGFSPDDYFPDGSSGNGTGALVGHDVWSPESPHFNGTIMETDSVYSGRLAMPLYYDNSASPYKSEATRTWTTAQDWTFNDVNTLVVHLQGAPRDFVETSPDSIAISGAGADIYNTADEFTFAHKPLVGDCTAIARIDSLILTNAAAKAGLMIRESLEPDSRFAMSHVTGSNGFRFTTRLTTAGDAANDGGQATPEQNAARCPLWLKLERTGNEFNAYYSNDPATEGWTASPSNPQTVVMGGTIYVGLAVTSHNTSMATTAEFSGIEITGASGAWTFSEIGVDHLLNSAANLYVTVTDTAGRSASVLHPDGTDAVLSSEWRPWALDLSEFVSAGVNLQAVRTMAIGVGDPANPQPDGTGMVLIDDIRIMQGAPEEPNDVQ